MKFILAAVPAALCAVSVTSVNAQAPSGTSLQENGPRALGAPQQKTGPTVHAPQSESAAAGGPTVVLSQIEISGNRTFSSMRLLSVVGNYRGQRLDFAGLTAIADKVTMFYRDAGYPFAQAYLPPQDLSNGSLRIVVVEGTYGQVKATGNPRFADRAQEFLSALKPGAAIESGPLERAALILADQPGIKITSVLRPSSEQGSGDLSVDVQRDHYVSGEVGVDDYGNRFTGRGRAHVNLDLDSPFFLGDQIAVQGMYTDENMWFGSAAYSAPLGSSGLRGRVSFTHSYYDLGGNFSGLGATGTADVTSAGISYPLVRSQQRNITLLASFEHKQLRDDEAAVSQSTRRSSNEVPLEVDFDMRDGLGRGGLTYGVLAFTPGDLQLDDASLALDAQTAHAAGRFGKLDIDVARIQSIADHIDVYGRFSAQWSTGNLDSSEKFGLGGINGVRAYPSGEGYGDEGWLAQIEIRYTAGSFGPYIFYDAGSIALNHTPWTVGPNHRSIGGAGVGMRYLQGHWSGNVSVAWRTYGGAPTSDTQHGTPVLWAGAQYRF
jgi:hemolysin activation/secretion protein